MRISDWSSDVCSSDLLVFAHGPVLLGLVSLREIEEPPREREEDEAGGDDDAKDEQDFHDPYLGLPERIASGKPVGGEIGGKRAAIDPRGAERGERGGGVALCEPSAVRAANERVVDRKSTRLNSSH